MLQRFLPHLYFHESEPFFPISIEAYLDACELRQNNTSSTDPDLSNSRTLTLNVDVGVLGEYTDSKLYANTFLNFKEGAKLDLLGGDWRTATCYGKEIQLDDTHYALVYFYLYKQTRPYNFCWCCPCQFTSYAHPADLKAVVIYVDEEKNVSGAYFAAHSNGSGEYVDAKDMLFTYDGHPMAFACFGDHSMYRNPGCHPRIFGVVQDHCDLDVGCVPELVEVTNETGWCNFAGTMNLEISSPVQHNWWNNGMSLENTNNWFKRLFCYNYW